VVLVLTSIVLTGALELAAYLGAKTFADGVTTDTDTYCQIFSRAFTKNKARKPAINCMESTMKCTADSPVERILPRM
jgi:hypothetical protein